MTAKKNYDKVYGNTPPKEEAAKVQRPKVVGIEGGRAIQAGAVKEFFDDAAKSVSDGCEMPAGYFIVMWSDEGFLPSSCLYQGHRSPYSPRMLKDAIEDQFDAEIILSAEGE